jgi:hypothetical protein
LRTQGKLPSTKASLYQQFADTIYEWKQDRFPTNLAERQRLDRALGKLALLAISLVDLDAPIAKRGRFRLHHHLVLELLEPDLLELALQLGWLNQVGLSASTGAKIYAFYHSTFQEYFAARSIADWHYFFEGDTDNHSPIFSPDWQETILFWFGRRDVQIGEKEAFIQALINFTQDRGGFYYYRAYFLAAAALAEFPESIHTQAIIDRLLQWRFAEFIPAQNTWKFYPLPIQDGARIALRQTDRVAAIAGLEKFVQAVENPLLRWQSAHSLGKVFDPGNAIAIQALVTSIETVHSSDLLVKICESLFKIDPNYNNMAIEILVEKIAAQQPESATRKSAFTLGKLLLERSPDIDTRNLLFALAIDTLARIISSSQNRDNQIAALDNLRQIAPTHPATQQQFSSDRTLPSSTRNRRKKVAHQREIGIAIAELERKLVTAIDAESQRRYAYQLGKFQPGQPIAVDALLKLMSSAQPASFYKRTVEYIKEVILDEQLPLVITQLKDCIAQIESGDRSASAMECYKLLWYCAERLPDRQFIQIWDR